MAVCKGGDAPAPPVEAPCLLEIGSSIQQKKLKCKILSLCF